MDYLDRIIGEHEKIDYLIDRLNILGINKDIVTRSANPRQVAAKMISETGGFGINLAHAILRCRSVEYISPGSHQFNNMITLSSLLDDELHELDHRAIGAALAYRELIPRLKEAFKRKIKDIDIGIYRYNFFKQLMGDWGWDLKHLEYWDFTQSTEVNLTAIGFHPNRNLIPFIVKQYSDLKDKPLGELWTTEYLSNVFKPKYIYDVLLENSSIYQGDSFSKSGRLLKAIFNPCTENEYKDWHTKNTHPALIALWVMQYKTWFNYQTNVYVPEYDVTIAVNHHELVSIASKHRSFWERGAINQFTHPKDHFALLIETTALSTAHRILSKRKTMKPFPLSPFDPCDLPDTWRHISSDHELISEGQIMHHCCGGEHYINSVQKSTSVFYHIDTNENYGLTAEFRPYTLDRIRQMTNLDQWSKMDNGYLGSDGHYVWIPHQVKGRFNRNPTKQELFELNLAIIKVSDLVSWYGVIGVDRVGVHMSDDSVIILSVNDPDFKVKYIDAVTNGADKCVYLTPGEDVPSIKQEETEKGYSWSVNIENIRGYANLWNQHIDANDRHGNFWGSMSEIPQETNKTPLNNGWGFN